MGSGPEGKRDELGGYTTDPSVEKVRTGIVGVNGFWVVGPGSGIVSGPGATEREDDAEGKQHGPGSRVKGQGHRVNEKELGVIRGRRRGRGLGAGCAARSVARLALAHGGGGSRVQGSGSRVAPGPGPASARRGPCAAFPRLCMGRDGRDKRRSRRGPCPKDQQGT